MKNKLKTYGVVMIAAVLLVAMAFAGAASADTEIATFTDLQKFMKTGGEGHLTADVIIAPVNNSYVENDVTLDLNGYKLVLGAESSTTALEATITVNQGVSFNLTNSAAIGKTGSGGFYNNGHLIANGAVNVSSIKWSYYSVPATSFTQPDCGGIIYGLNGTFAIGSAGSLKLTESQDKSPNLIMAANPKMLSSSSSGAKFIIVQENYNDKSYVAQKDGDVLVWAVEGTNPTMTVTGVCADPTMGALFGKKYTEYVNNNSEVVNRLLERMESGTITIKLIDDVTMEKPFEIVKDVTLDLNGWVLESTAPDWGIRVQSSILNITDSNPTTEHIFHSPIGHQWELVKEPTEEMLETAISLDDFNITEASLKDGFVRIPGGVLVGYEGSYNNGCIVCDASLVNMYSGSIVGCSAGSSNRAAAVYLPGGGEFNMTGGNIAGCWCKDDMSSTVLVTNGAQFSMGGNARIIGCGGAGQIEKSASAILAMDGRLVRMMDDAEISNCYSLANNCAVCILQSDFEVSGNAMICDNIISPPSGKLANVYLNNEHSLKLVGPLTGRIGITMSTVAEGIQFGTATDLYQEAVNIFSDANPFLRGLVYDDSPNLLLIWAPAALITIADVENGYAIANVSATRPGDYVTVTAYPDDGYIISDYSADRWWQTKFDDQMFAPDRSVTFRSDVYSGNTLTLTPKFIENGTYVLKYDQVSANIADLNGDGVLNNDDCLGSYPISTGDKKIHEDMMKSLAASYPREAYILKANFWDEDTSTWVEGPELNDRDGNFLPDVSLTLPGGTNIAFTNSKGEWIYDSFNIYNGSNPETGLKSKLHFLYIVNFGETVSRIDSYTSSHHETGYTQILQEIPTTTPTTTPTPTVAPTAVPTPVVTPTAKPTTQATQSSPAPIAGIIAGLGAAALVLTRLRR